MPLNILLAGGANAPAAHAFANAAQELAGGGDIFVTSRPFQRANEIDDVRRLTKRLGIGLIVPTIDDDLPLWAAFADEFFTDGTHVAVSPASTVAMCHDRHLTCHSLNLLGISAAATWLPGQVSRNVPMPLFVLSRNPRRGPGRVRVTTYGDLDLCLSLRTDAVVQAELEGPEFSVELCCDLSGRLVAVSPNEYAELAVRIASVVRFAGPASIHGTLSNDRPVVRAITPRLSDAMDMTEVAGARLARVLIETALERRRRLMCGGATAAIGAAA
jgi:hypothetical protein